VADIDVLVLGEPDRTDLYATASAAEAGLGRPVQVTVRAAGWLQSGAGNSQQDANSGEVGPRSGHRAWASAKYRIR